MKTKKKTLIAIAVATLFFPLFVSAADWGVGVSTNGNGITGVSVGVGSSGWGSNYGGWTLSNPYGLPQGSVLGIASNLLFWLLAIFALMGVIGFVIAGIIYLISAGDETAIARAKNAMTWSIVGVVVGLSGFLIMQAIAALLSGGSSKF